MYALMWLDEVLNDLAAIYVAATAEERQRMAGAVAGLNARLRSDPQDVGESRDGDTRVAVVALLVVTFVVDVGPRTVRVANVRRYGR
ncbi:MAG TPA: hypothetical protein VD866_16400 [Urbifossiella sp.]|nr:hypothetical protein [Urbifossiella sp.]